MLFAYPPPLDTSRKYLGSYSSFEEVIRVDTRELETVSGSFKEIAEQLQRLLDFAARPEHPQYAKCRPLLEVVSERFLKGFGSGFDRDQYLWELYGLERCRTLATLPETQYSDRIAVLDTVKSTGHEPCPFKCQDALSFGVSVRIFNYFSDKRLTISNGMEHLVRVHNFLPKAPPGIGLTVAEFYAHFMPPKQEERRESLPPLQPPLHLEQIAGNTVEPLLRAKSAEPTRVTGGNGTSEPNGSMEPVPAEPSPLGNLKSIQPIGAQGPTDPDEVQTTLTISSASPPDNYLVRNKRGQFASRKNGRGIQKSNGSAGAEQELVSGRASRDTKKVFIP